MLVATGLLVSSIICAFAGAPRDFRIPGANPARLRDWSWTGSRWRTEAEVLDATAVRYGNSIDEDQKILAEGSRRLHAALLVALGSCLAGVAHFNLLKLHHKRRTGGSMPFFTGTSGCGGGGGGGAVSLVMAILTKN